MSAPPPPSFSSFPDLESLRPPQQPSQKDRDRPSKRARRSVEVEEDDDERRRKESSSSSRRKDRDRDDDGHERKDRKDRKHGSHRDRETDREREKRKEKERSSTSSKHHHRSRPLTPPPPPPPPAAASTLFYKDSRGDEANKTYGSLHGPSVAKFYRSGGELPFSFLSFQIRRLKLTNRFAASISQLETSSDSPEESRLPEPLPEREGRRWRWSGIVLKEDRTR